MCARLPGLGGRVVLGCEAASVVDGKTADAPRATLFVKQDHGGVSGCGRALGTCMNVCMVLKETDWYAKIRVLIDHIHRVEVQNEAIVNKHL